MNDDLFRELEASVREGGAILAVKSFHLARSCSTVRMSKRFESHLG